MSNIIHDFTGEKIDKLKVIELIGKNKQGNMVFLCLCDCGKYLNVSGGNLSRKGPHSCGCHRWNRISENRTEKVCSKCKIVKSIELFSINNSRKDKHSQYCISCKREYFKHKRVSDPSFRVAANLRTKIYQSIRDNKKFKFYDLLGCDIEFLKKHLELKFREGMSWENYGRKGWHIDHIKPCSSFDMTKIEEQKLCFHFTNLQPLWWEENLKKYNKV